MFRREPPNWERMNQEGIELAEQGAYKEAVDKFKQAIRLKPDAAEAHDNLGVIYSHLQEFISALLHHAKAIELDPNDPTPLYNLARLIQYQGDLISHQAYERAIELAPDYPDVHYQLAMLYAEEGEFEKAIALLRKSIQLDPSHAEDFNGLGYAYMMLGDEKKARNYWFKAIALDFNNYYAHLSLSALYAIHNDFERCFSHMTKAVSVDGARAREDVAYMEQFDYVRSHPKVRNLLSKESESKPER